MADGWGEIVGEVEDVGVGSGDELAEIVNELVAHSLHLAEASLALTRQFQLPSLKVGE